MSNRTLAKSRTKLASTKSSRIFPPLVAEGGKPLYMSAKNVIRRAIDEGRFTADEKMPSTQQLASELDVSLVTAHRAMQELVSGGVLRRLQGRGTFVNPVAGTGSGVRARGRLGVVLHRDSSLADYYHGRIVEGVRQASHDLHADLLLLRFGEDLRQECDGMLFINPLRDEVTKVGEHARAGMPCVVVGAQLHGDGYDHGDKPAALCCIDTDNHAIARQAAAHLQKLDHVRIGFVGGNDTISNSRDRWAGFEAAVPEPAMSLRSGGWRLTASERATLAKALTEPNRPTAIVAAGYYFALDVYAAAAKAGLEIGRDLSVIAVDDPPSAELLSPPLTTMRQPLKDLGRRAVELLLAAAGGRDTPHETLPPELVRRASTQAGTGTVTGGA